MKDKDRNYLLSPELIAQMQGKWRTRLRELVGQHKADVVIAGWEADNSGRKLSNSQMLSLVKCAQGLPEFVSRLGHRFKEAEEAIRKGEGILADFQIAGEASTSGPKQPGKSPPSSELVMKTKNWRALSPLEKGQFKARGGEISHETMTRGAFEKLSNQARVAFCKSGGVLTG